MKKHNIFPHRYYCSDRHGWGDSPRLARLVWDRIRTLSTVSGWYAVDMEIISENSINLYVYDMADNFRGGIGARIHEQVITEFTTQEQALLDEYILELKTAAAAEEFHRREEDARNKAVMKIRKELFGI
jgi:hypothetical protein